MATQSSANITRASASTTGRAKASASVAQRRSLTTSLTSSSTNMADMMAAAPAPSAAPVAPKTTRRVAGFMARPQQHVSFTPPTSHPIRAFTTAAPRKVTPVTTASVSLPAASAPAFVMAAGLRKFSTERKAGYITLNFTTPAGPVLPRSPVHMFEVSTIEGDMGVIADHSPFIGELRPGVVKVFTEPGADAKKWFVPGGFMVIKNDSQADITASEAIPVEELDADVARKTLEQANAQLSQATDELAKAEATITIDVCNAVIKAAESV